MGRPAGASASTANELPPSLDSAGGVVLELAEGLRKLLDAVLPLVQQETAQARELFDVGAKETPVTGIAKEDERVAQLLLEGVEAEVEQLVRD